MNALEITDLQHQFGQNRVLCDINLRLMPGQFLALVGGSGCGKTTLLKTILGTLRPTSGTLFVNGDPIEGPNRNVGIVFQKYTLDISRTAEKNVALGLKLDKSNYPYRIFKYPAWRKMAKEHLRISREMLNHVHLNEVHWKNYPGQLSGGQQQRVAIAQALVMKPKVLLLDEPFGALDEATRESAQRMLQRMYQENITAAKANQAPPHTVIIVTHELHEALIVSDRIIGLSRNWLDGDVKGQDVGSTIVYDKPTPVYNPNDPHQLKQILDQKEEVRNIVLSDTPKCRREHVTYWDEVSAGRGTGLHTPEMLECQMVSQKI